MLVENAGAVDGDGVVEKASTQISSRCIRGYEVVQSRELLEEKKGPFLRNYKNKAHAIQVEFWGVLTSIFELKN